MINRDEIYELLSYMEKILYNELNTSKNSQEVNNWISEVELRDFCNKSISLLNEIVKEDTYEQYQNKPLARMGADIANKVIFDEPIQISEFVKNINNQYIGTRRIKIAEITKWLLSEGYLEEKPYREKKNYKKATNKGLNIGIEFIEKTSEYGNKYGVNFYNKDAQVFILKHLGFNY